MRSCPAGGFFLRSNGGGSLPLILSPAPLLCFWLFAAAVWRDDTRSCASRIKHWSYGRPDYERDRMQKTHELDSAGAGPARRNLKIPESPGVLHGSDQATQRAKYSEPAQPAIILGGAADRTRDASARPLAKTATDQASERTMVLIQCGQRQPPTRDLTKLLPISRSASSYRRSVGLADLGL